MKATIALVQMSSSDSRDENVARAAELVREAGDRGAQIVSLSDAADEPSTQEIGKAARDAGVWVVLPFYEVGEDGELYNSTAVLNRAGEVTGVYRKDIIPLMSFDGTAGGEELPFRPGDLGHPMFETDLGIVIGITICYERHLPEGPRALALGRADVIFVPTATPAGKQTWEPELRATPIANLLWVGGIERVGGDQDDAGSQMESYGGSVLMGPDGAVAARAANDGSDEIVMGEIDTAPSAELREDWGFLRERRPEVYGALIAP